MLIQYIGTIIILIILAQLIVKLFKDRISILGSFMWIIFWVSGLIFIWSPELLDMIGGDLGVGRGIDVIIYMSIILIFYIIINQNNKIRKLQKEITKLVRELAKYESM